MMLLMMLPLVSCDLADDFKELRADELRRLIDEGAQILIVDVRSEFEYKEGHIPKAAHIPQEQFKALGVLLPKDKAFPVVFYCRGAG